MAADLLKGMSPEKIAKKYNVDVKLVRQAILLYDKLRYEGVEQNDPLKEIKNPFGLFSGKAGFNKANIEMEKTLKKAYKQKTFAKAREVMAKVQKKYYKLGADDTEPDEIIHQLLNKHFKTKVSRTGMTD